MQEDPLAVRPGVVVLGVESEGFRREVELAGRVVEREDDRPAVLPVAGRGTRRGQLTASLPCYKTTRDASPDLVRFEVVLDELVEEVKFGREVGLHLEERIGAVLPARVPLL